KGSFVIERIKNSRHDRLKFQGYQADLHPKLAEIVLNDSRDLRALSIAGIDENRKLHRFAACVYKHPVRPAGETCRADQSGSSLHRPWWMGNCRIDPQLVSRRDLVPERSRAALIHQTNDGFAIDGRGDGLPKFIPAEPYLFAPDLRQLFCAQVVEIEEEEVVFEAG